ncbi:nuclear pore complex protein Nup205 [Drosophila tropicalis]|uniref:nuclear pore complex protein Nup205 n=1 Tax=Drosophila tropicalis TaxID=46794 RepID=UPI0035ABCC9C
MDASVTEDMWAPYKHLYGVIQSALNNPKEVTSDLEICLKRYKQNFTNFLRNPPKSEKSRSQLRNTVIQDGIQLPGQSRKVQISQELVDEALILSDMFDLDEIFAVELLCTAQRQQMHHPGLPRGLVAVLLYYDGRKAMSCALRDMFQVVAGVAWSTDLPREITCLITSFSQSLVDDTNILGRLLELLSDMDIDKESLMLTKNRAFGSKKHQNRVLGMYKSIRKSLAMALFNWSAQRGLPKLIAIRLLQYLANSKAVDTSGCVDDITLTMLMALLYSYDTSVLLFNESQGPYASRLPIFADQDFAKGFYDALYGQSNWQSPRLDCIIKYSFGLTLASLRHAPSNLQAAAGDIINRDEQLIDEALAANIFGFFYRQLLEKEIVYTTQFFYRRVHMLITDFIDFMHAKVAELRGRADETARTVISFTNEGLEPPTNLDTNFELLMLCVAKLYGDKRSCVNLCNEYWGPAEAGGGGNAVAVNAGGSTTTTTTASGNNGNYLKNTARSVSLFKFISLASELLPQTLFKSYLKMLTGLTRTKFSARCAFNLLKNSQTLTPAYAVSWDHFFTALTNYYNNMRNDVNFASMGGVGGVVSGGVGVGAGGGAVGGGFSGTGDTIYRSRTIPRSMTQRETEHLLAVMGIIQSVTEYDEISRLMICEHSNWQTPQVLLGLVTCSTPLVLKAKLLFTLAALAKSKDTARAIWFHLEESQIIPTIPVATTYTQSSLAEEIEQNESRLETYEMSRGILHLLHTLMTTHMPKSLGVGTRKPGYDAYFNFILDTILLKFYNRAYKDPAEKWEVGAKCLKLLYFLLATYQPRASDFLELRDEHPYPGYHIMLHLHVKSDMLRLLLRVIEEARERLDDYNDFRGKEFLEECSLYALLMLEMGVSKQNAFFEAHSTANCPILLSGLNRMLLDLNPRSRKPDYVLNITKYVTYNSWLPRHTLAAIKILGAVTLLPNVAGQILTMYAQGSNEKLEIRQGFVECLEMDCNFAPHHDELLEQLNLINPYEGAAPPTESENSSSLETRQPLRIEFQIKEAIVELFQLNLNQPLPNFVCFLLGIDVLRDFMANEKQQLGIEMHCSCLNSLILAQEKYLEKQRNSEEYCEHTAHLVERIYNLLYGLCANRRTSETILRYFRLSCNDFILRHLNSMPFRHPTEEHILHAMSHLLNCVAIEIKLAALHGQTTRYNLLCDILLAGNPEQQQRNIHPLPLELTQATSNFYGVDGTSVVDGAINVTIMQENALGLHANRLLDCLTFDSYALTQPRLEFFDSRLIAQVLKDCEVPNASAAAASAAISGGGNQGSTSLVNIRKLHDILHDELRMVQSTIASGQRKAITIEIATLLQHGIEINRVRTHRWATLNFMNAWCQVVQILFSSMPEAVLQIAARRQYIIDIIEKILMKVQPMQPLIEISIQITETVLLLLANLRYCCHLMEDQGMLDDQTKDQNTDSNGGASIAPDGGSGISPDGVLMAKMARKSLIFGNNNSSSNNIRFILKKLVEWIMVSEVKSQKLRINLYSALLNCLRIVKRLRSDDHLGYHENLVSRLDSSRGYNHLHLGDELMQQKEMAAEVIGAFGEKLIDTICHDAVTGHDICRMLALACLDMISELNAVSTLSEFITVRGYLKNILDSLAKSTEDLCGILQPVPENLRALYVYESRMSFLTRIAQTSVGAHLLLGERVLGVLSNMRVYDLQPDLKASELKRNYPKEFIPNIDERFRAILLPALALCDAIMNSLGSTNMSASLQILNFLFAHIDMVEAMLRTATPFMDLCHLQQLAAITNLFARTTSHDVTTLEDGLDVQNDIELRCRLSCLQQLMIVVFGRFTVSEQNIRQMINQQQQQHHHHHPHLHEHEQDESKQSLHIKYFLDIAANLSLYCRNAVTSHAKDGMTSKYLLTTMINDITPLTGKSDGKKLTAIMHTILNQLKGSIGYYLSQKSIADNLLQQRASLPNITFGPSGKQSYLELSQRHNEKRSELMQAVFIAEQNLYLLWIHLDFYLRNAVLYIQENRNAINESNLDPTNLAVLYASQDEVIQLKQLLISTFNETFCTQLINASEGYTVKCKGFNASLLRRIKALVQFAPVQEQSTILYRK